MPVLCPICSANIAENETSCPKCRADLSIYLALFYSPDILFNEALKLIEAEQYRQAYDKLAAAFYMRPHDLEIMTAMAKCREICGDYVGAMEKIALAMVKSENPALKQEYGRLNSLLEAQAAKSKKETETVAIVENLKNALKAVLSIGDEQKQ